MVRAGQKRGKDSNERAIFMRDDLLSYPAGSSCLSAKSISRMSEFGKNNRACAKDRPSATLTCALNATYLKLGRGTGSFQRASFTSWPTTWPSSF